MSAMVWIATIENYFRLARQHGPCTLVAHSPLSPLRRGAGVTPL
jgi:hypothetical protein